MSDAHLHRFSRRNLFIGLAAGAALAVVSLLASGGLSGFAGADAFGRLHAPRLSLLAAAAPAVQLHVAAALAAFVIGAVLLVGPKGTLPHRTLGWTWAGAMVVTAVSSFFIRQVNPGSFSFIHLISGWTMVALPGALYAARRHRVAVHRSSMLGMYFGGMVLAGAFTFVPGRLMWRLFFG